VDPSATRTPLELFVACTVVAALAGFGTVALLPWSLPAMPLAGGAAMLTVGMTLLLTGTTTRTLRAAHRTALAQATAHPLSGLATPQVAELVLGTSFAAAQRGRTLTVVLLRVEEFPRYGARHGRASAEMFLRGAGRIFRKHTRRMHTTAHWGTGDATYLTILSDIPVDGACIFARRVRKELAALPGPGAPAISVAVVGFDLSMESPADLMGRASRALAKAGEAGGKIIAVGLNARPAEA
jgi:GGDEF domain-containing protein